MSRKSIFLASAGLLAVGLIAISPLRSAAGPTPPVGLQHSSSIAAVGYSVNSKGESYGSAADAANPSDLPDLIEVQATNGVFGYITKASFLGTPPTLQQVLSYPKDSEGNLVAPSTTVPVYSSDGTTQVGTFDIGGSGPSSNLNP